MYGGGCGGGYDRLHNGIPPEIRTETDAIGFLFSVWVVVSLVLASRNIIPGWLVWAVPLGWFLWFGWKRERSMTPEEKAKEDEFFRKMEEGREFHPNEW